MAIITYTNFHCSWLLRSGEEDFKRVFTLYENGSLLGPPRKGLWKTMPDLSKVSFTKFNLNVLGHEGCFIYDAISCRSDVDKYPFMLFFFRSRPTRQIPSMCMMLIQHHTNVNFNQSKHQCWGRKLFGKGVGVQESKSKVMKAVSHWKHVRKLLRSIHFP